MRYLLALILSVVLPSLGVAGPWPRGEGKMFVSTSTSFSWPVDAIGADQWQYTSIYLERGMKRQLTFGVDAGLNGEGNYAGFAFVRAPILKRFDPQLFAVRIGLGMTGSSESSEALAMFGAAWGRGFESRFGGGWATVDFQAHYLTAAGDLILKTDATLGIKPTEQLKLILQLQAGAYPGNEPFMRLAPSVAWQFAKGRHLEVGGQVGLLNDDRIGLKVGTWLEF